VLRQVRAARTSWRHSSDHNLVMTLIWTRDFRRRPLCSSRAIKCVEWFLNIPN
jgi:hypothetical protein